MEQKISNMKQSTLHVFLRALTRSIESHLGEPQNPDDMLDEAREVTELYGHKIQSATSLSQKFAGIDNAEDRAFKDLKLALQNAKKWTIAFAGEKWLEPLAFPQRMPRVREQTKEQVRAILSAWDDHSTEPQLIPATLGFEKLKIAYEAFIIAWDKQEDAGRTSKDEHRNLHEARKRAEKFVRKAKNYLALHLDPYSPIWHLYGFEPRKRRGEK